MKRGRKPSGSTNYPSVQERAELALKSWSPEAPVMEQEPEDPIQRRMWQLERELRELKEEPEAFKRKEMLTRMSKHPQGKVIMITMMLWYDRHKAEIKERSPSLYKWLMDGQENLAISAEALRSVALHIEALADLVESNVGSPTASVTVPS